MALAENISQLRSRLVAELRNLEGELSKELNNVRQEITRLSPTKRRRQQRHSATADNKTVSILAGKVCPKCGKKGHDMRWHRWNDTRKSRQNGSKKAV